MVLEQGFDKDKNLWGRGAGWGILPEGCRRPTAYVELFAGQPGRQARAKALADKVMDFSTFAKEKLGLSAESFNHSDERSAPAARRVTYHASCHLCRGLGVKEAPRELIAAAADYVPAAEEEVCCGFGGTYSAKFPEVSAALLRKKLDGIADTGAARVVMDCPGCVASRDHPPRGAGSRRTQGPQGDAEEHLRAAG